MTPEQEVEQAKVIETLSSKLAALEPTLAKVSTLEAQNQSLQKQLEEVKKGHDLNSQELAIQKLKTAYPDVPLEMIQKLPDNIREQVAKETQESINKVKAKAATPNGDPLADWTRAGGIGPTDDATIAAEQAATAKKVAEAKAQGNVFDMLAARGTEVLGHLRRSYAKNQ